MFGILHWIYIEHWVAMLERVKQLRNLNILDTPEEEIFNDIVQTASFVCEAPISLITLLDKDRQWFKAKYGTEVSETPIEVAFCRFTIEEDSGQLAVEDLTEDVRFKNNPFVTHEPNLRSYLGISITTPSKVKIGTVCVFDHKKRKFTDKQIASLNALANYTSKLIEDKIRIRTIEERNQTLLSLNKNLESFAYMVAHDVKAPLRIINSYSKLILSKQPANLGSDIEEYLCFIHQSTQNLGNLVDNMLEYARQIQIKRDDFELFSLRDLVDETIYALDPDQDELQYDIQVNDMQVFTSKNVLRQVIQNIVSNSLKYKDKGKEVQRLSISAIEQDKYYQIQFEDNGIGMSEQRLKEVFNLFEKDQRHKLSTGVGFSVIQELLKKIGGEIKVDSQLSVGTQVTLKIPVK